MSGQRVSVVVDRLCVHGMSRNDGERVGRVFCRELTHLLESRGVPSGLQRDADASTLRLPAVPGAAGNVAEPLGRALAGTVYESLAGTAHAAPAGTSHDSPAGAAHSSPAEPGEVAP